MTSNSSLRLNIGPTSAVTTAVATVPRAVASNRSSISTDRPWLRVVVAAAAVGTAGFAAYRWYCARSENKEDEALFETLQESRPKTSNEPSSSTAAAAVQVLDSTADDEVRVAKIKQISDLLPRFGVHSAEDEGESSQDKEYETDLELEWNIANEMEEVVREQLLELADQLTDVEEGNESKPTKLRKRRGAKPQSSMERDAKFLKLAKDYFETCQERTSLKRRMQAAGIWDNSHVDFENPAFGTQQRRDVSRGDSLWGTHDSAPVNGGRYYDHFDDEDDDDDDMGGRDGIDHEMPWDEDLDDDNNDDQWEDEDDDGFEDDDDDDDDEDAVAEMMAAYGIDPEAAQNMTEDEMEEMMQFMFEKELTGTIDRLQAKAAKRGYEAPEKVTSEAKPKPSIDSTTRKVTSRVEEIDDNHCDDDDDWETESEDEKVARKKSSKSKSTKSKGPRKGAVQGDTWIDL